MSSGSFGPWVWGQGSTCPFIAGAEMHSFAGVDPLSQGSGERIEVAWAAWGIH